MTEELTFEETQRDCLGRTVSELDSLFFAEGEKPYSFAIHESDLREIDGHSALFPFDQFV
jgi:hypothetical protein